MPTSVSAIRAVALVTAGLSASTLGQPSATSAAAAEVVSSNWAGYAVTASSSSATFRRVSSSWKVSRGSCSSGQGYSAAWIGLGGYSETSQALEQTGTELDCSAASHASYSAWYELVPAAAKTIRMKVRPGDTMSALVSVRGNRVSIRLRNLTRKKVFARTFTMSSPDVTSAEWIVEAPSGCTESGDCFQLPLANFGTLRLTRARATNGNGHTGSISDPSWSATKLTLSETGSGGSTGALASKLSSGGTAFSVSYQRDSSLAKPRAKLPASKRAVG